MLTGVTGRFAGVPDAASRADYATTISYDNVLGKNSTSPRRLSEQRLGELYGFDPNVRIFQVLRRLSAIDREGRPLLALLCALGRDPLFRATASTILALSPGEELVRSTFTRAA